MAGRKLADVHIRLDKSVYDYAKQIGNEYRLSLAEVIRRALGNSLESMAKDIRYLDHQQATEIRKAILQIYDKVNHIDMVISGIGNNTNQIAHIANIRAKIYEEKGNRFPNEELIRIYQKQMADAEIKMNNSINTEKISQLCEEYKKISEMISNELWRFVQ